MKQFFSLLFGAILLTGLISSCTQEDVLEPKIQTVEGSMSIDNADTEPITLRFASPLQREISEQRWVSVGAFLAIIRWCYIERHGKGGPNCSGSGGFCERILAFGMNCSAARFWDQDGAGVIAEFEYKGSTYFAQVFNGWSGMKSGETYTYSQDTKRGDFIIPAGEYPILMVQGKGVILYQ